MDGSKHHGTMEAVSVPQLSAFLTESGLFLVDQKVAQGTTQQKKLKTIELADFCRQLAAMLSSGITLIRAMTIIEQRDAKPHVKKVYETVIADLRRGSSLSEAMELQGRAFPPLLINMMRAGENSGGMDATALKMAVTFDKQHKLDGKMKSASVYPIILVFMILAVIIILFTFVLPQFAGLFGNMELPLPTQIMMNFSSFLINYWMFLLVGIIVGISGLIALFRRPGPKLQLDRFKLKIPKIGKLLSTVYTARFARTLSSLYVSGIPMIQALTIARATVDNSYIEKQFDMVINNLGNGRTLSQALADVDGFEKKLNSTILIGEESGRLEQMLESVADQFDYDSEMATQQMVSMMEPIMIIVLAVVVAFVIISVLLPIFQMYQGIEGS
ncbi:MAG: type II secretion system F family protein [Coriobacteriales bacterium]|jgi:type IV pilus assembly protein PilC|nr:type II secretion system F family protein [Coriobacteriales bacterium]